MNDKNNKIIWWLLIAIAIILPVSYFIYYKINKHKKQEAAAIVRYTAFGIEMPPNYTIHGIDVSSYQSYIHWPAVKEMEINQIKIGFAFIKATEGLNDTDRFFKHNWKKLKENNIPRGAYLFFLATKSGKKQAENFIKNVQLDQGDLPPVVDIEELYGVPKNTMQARLTECLTVLQEHYKVKPIVYSYANFYENNLGKKYDDYPLWIAHYFEKNNPRISRDWQFWQHNEKGSVNGITTKVDFNVFNGDSSAFKKILIP
jgi:lysozyme